MTRGGSPQGASTDAQSVLLRFGAVFSCIPIFPFSASFPSLFTLFPTSPSPISVRLSNSQVNKKLSSRGQNALSVVKKHERNNDSEHILYLSVRQSIDCMASRLSVRSSVTNL